MQYTLNLRQAYTVFSARFNHVMSKQYVKRVIIMVAKWADAREEDYKREIVSERSNHVGFESLPMIAELEDLVKLSPRGQVAECPSGCELFLCGRK